jgi:hypothetical protein
MASPHFWLMPSNLCVSFRRLSSWTWNKLTDACAFKVPFSEESITESLLIQLAKCHRRDLQICAFSKQDEGTGTKATGGKPTGADWSFWVVGPKGKGVEIRLQAKRQFPSGKYESLNGKSKQINDLWNNRGKAVPFYLFYNGDFAHDKHGARWPIWTGCGSCGIRFRGQTAWGCSVTSLRDVWGKVSPYPADLLKQRPWFCLVCAACWSASGAVDLPSRMIALANSMYSADNNAECPDDMKNADFGVAHEDAPSWVRLLESEEGSDDWKQFWANTDLRGVAIIKQTNLDIE